MGKWLSLIELILPIVLRAIKVPHADTISPLVVHGIQEAEAMKGQSGAEKLAYAVNIMNIGIDGANASGAKIDKAAVNSVVSDGISTAVGVVNLINNK